MEDFLVFESITKRFGSATALDGVNVGIHQGEVFSLLGPSGCGKTTLLRLAAGFEQPDGGRVLLEGKDITALPPNKRPVNTVFQNYALFPHMSVWDNISFGLRVAGRNKTDIDREVGVMLSMIQLTEHAAKRPAQLSGGQKQRVAIARALINKPRVLLLDEPLAALDLKLRQRMLLELSAIHQEVGTTFIYVTHDQTEAMSLSDRIAVMNHGKVEQLGSPADLYERPESDFVASFIGDTNMLQGIAISHHDGKCEMRVAGAIQMQVSSPDKLAAQSEVRMSLRPERIDVVTTPALAGDSQLNHIQGILEERVYLGAAIRCWVRAESVRFCAEIPLNRSNHEGRRLERGQPVWLSFAPEDVTILRNRSSA